MNEELNSTATSLRNVFFSKVAAPEDVERACGQLAEKLAGDLTSNHDAKLALLDLLEEALHGKDFYPCHTPAGYAIGTSKL